MESFQGVLGLPRKSPKGGNQEAAWSDALTTSADSFGCWGPGALLKLLPHLSGWAQPPSEGNLWLPGCCDKREGGNKDGAVNQKLHLHHNGTGADPSLLLTKPQSVRPLTPTHHHWEHDPEMLKLFHFSCFTLESQDRNVLRKFQDLEPSLSSSCSTGTLQTFSETSLLPVYHAH